MVIVLHDEREIVAALGDDRLVPPPAASAAGAPTMTLRASMARFSAPADHDPRRAAVLQVVNSLDVAAVAIHARARAAAALEEVHARGRRVELIAQVARPSTVEAIAMALDVVPDALPAVVADVDAIVAVIGRGAAASAASDAAVERLLAQFATHPGGAVAAVSALYQSMDATAALVATRLLDRTRNAPLTRPIARTTRVAASTTDVLGRVVPAGSKVDVEIGAAGLWFGAGRHECPGRALAERIAVEIVHAVEASGARVELAALDLDADARPLAVWLDLAASS